MTEKTKLARAPGPLKTLEPGEVARAEALVANLGAKAVDFLRGNYNPPSPEELTALRLYMRMSQAAMAASVGTSKRLWNELERNPEKPMQKPHFAMLTLFSLRSTPEWRRVSDVLVKSERTSPRQE